MLFLLSGSNENSIKKTEREILKRFPANERLSVATKDISASKLLDLTNTFDLLQQAPVITLNFEKSTDPTPFYEVLGKVNPQTHVIFIFPFDLNQNHVFVKNPENLKFISGNLSTKQLSDVFKFVDHLYSGNRDAAYKELALLFKEGADRYYLLSMCLYSLRNIFNVLFDSPELTSMKDFPRRKATQHSKAFIPDNVLLLFSYFYDIDKKCKTGLLDIDTGICLVCEKILSYTKA